jgi:acyl transferase domain-containing protein
MRAVLADRVPTVFIEISPHPLLISAIEDEVEACGADSVAVPSLRRHMSESEVMRTALGTAYVRGCTPDWTRVYDGGRSVPLPSYPWQRERFWVDSAQAATPAPAVPRQRTAADEQAVASRATPCHRPTVTSARGLAEHIAREAAEVLEAAPDSVDPAAPLRVAGMDSVLAARLCRRLRHDLDLNVPVDHLLEDRSLIEVAERITAGPAGANRSRRGPAGRARGGRSVSVAP